MDEMAREIEQNKQFIQKNSVSISVLIYFSTGAQLQNCLPFYTSSKNVSQLI